MINDASSESDAIDQSASADAIDTNSGDMVRIEGKITDVMESWPLQLTIETEQGNYYASLAETTVITRSGQPFEPGQLSPGQAVTVVGQRSPTEDKALVVDSIEVQ